MELHELINKFISENNYQSYLEIGVRKCYTFNRVECNFKEGIDPNQNHEHDTVFQIDSDTYFLENIADRHFDCIFIDALHTSAQVSRDIVNSLSILAQKGVILVHDVLPKHSDERVPGKSHTGDVWKGFLQSVLLRDDINYYTIPDCKTGVGVIYFEDCPVKDKLDFQTYREYGRKLLRVQDS